MIDEVIMNLLENASASIGLSLEKDWHSPQRRMYDLTFRSALVKHQL